MLEVSGDPGCWSLSLSRAVMCRASLVLRSYKSTLLQDRASLYDSSVDPPVVIAFRVFGLVGHPVQPLDRQGG